MNVTEAVLKRRSTRSFLAHPVPRETITQALELARWSPSVGNTQPWDVWVVSGEKVGKLSGGFCRKVVQQAEQKPDFPIPDIFTFEGGSMRRYRETGKSLFGNMGIRRDDYHKRFEHLLNNSSGYGAPHFLFVLVDQSLGIFSILDVGIFVQTFCLAATDLGLGTCIMANLVRYPEVIRELLPIPENKRLLIGIAFGYADLADPVNKFRSSREELSNLITWIE